jgi:hypothetical protein
MCLYVITLNVRAHHSRQQQVVEEEPEFELDCDPGECRDVDCTLQNVRVCPHSWLAHRSVGLWGLTGGVLQSTSG